MSVGPDPVALATGVLMERYHQDLEQATAMLRALAGKNGRSVPEHAGWLLANTTAADGDDIETEPAVIRRAVGFVHANAHRAIGITDIARAAGIGPRGLQHAFRRHRGQAPMSYLRQVRMENVHRDLVVGDPARGDTVSALAGRWGFTSPGRFAIEYRQIYGCRPGDVLRGQETPAAAGPSTTVTRAREARRQAEVLRDLASEASVQALLALGEAERVPLPPAVEARLCLLLGRSTRPEGLAVVEDPD